MRLGVCVVAELHGDAELRVLCGQLRSTVVVVDRSIERIVDSAIVCAIIIVVVDDCAFVVEQHTGGDVSEHACRERRRRWRRHGRCVRGASAVAVVLNALAGSGGPGQSTSTACTTTTTTCAAGGSSNYNSWNTTSLVFDSNGRTVSLS